MRLTLVRCGKTRWFFLWSHHHVLLDGWSAPLVLQDAFAAYRSLTQGDSIRLPARRPFRDYLAWLAGRGAAAAETYWRHALAGFRAPASLPFEPRSGSGPLRASGPFAERRVTLSFEKTRALEEFARRQKVTLNTLVQGACAILLGRCSGERDVLFGVTVSGRPAELAGAEAMVGLFINTLPLRVNLPPDATAAEWLRGLFRQNMELREHEHAALVDIQRWSELPPGEALFECLLAFENYPVDEALRAQQGSISARDVRFIEQTHYPLTIVAFPGPQLVLNASYDCARFDVEAVDRMLEYFSALLASIIASPDVRLGELSLLPREEWHRQIVEWNGRGTDCKAASCIHQLFEEQVRRTPDAIAVVFEDERLIYAKFNARANQLAHHLRSLGAGPGTVVGICAERSAEMVIGILAILKSGSAYLALDPANPAERLAFMLEDAGAAFVLTQEKLLGSVPQSASTICLDRDAALWASAPKADLESLGGPGNLAYVMYTSGSTGRPKGVMITHRNVTRLFAATQAEFGFGEDDVWSLFHSCAFDFSVWEIWGALLYGGRLVVVPYWVSRAPDDFYDLLLREQVTVLNQTPGAFCQLLQTQAFLEGRGPLALRLVIFGGEALDPRSLRPWFARYGEAHVRLVNMYGITETTVHVTLADQDFAELGSKGSIIGRPLSDLQTYILDAYLQPVPIGVEGELYVGGGGLARGYLERPDLTAERFVPNPFAGEAGTAGGGRLYRTGDLARFRPEGSIEYLGRIDHQVKIRGHRIELGEIEACLLAHPAVREAAVIAREDRPGEKQLVAFVAGKDGAALAAADLRSAIERQLPAYMVPSAFVSLDRLPLTVNGKVDRKALLASGFSGPAQTTYVAPRNPTEEILCQIWAETLGLGCAGIHDNYFELGGHSLLAVTLVERMRQEGLQADVRILFLSPTPSGLAEMMRNGDEGAIPPNLIPLGCEAVQPDMLPLVMLTQADIDSIVAAVPGGASNVQDIYPLAPLQEGILFHHLMSERGDPYLLPSLFAFDTIERLERFLEALRAVIARHDILRSAVRWEGLPEPVQVVWRTAPFIVEEVMLDPAEGDAAEQLRARYDPSKYRLDIWQAPLLRGYTAHDDATGRWLLLLLAHHLVSDHTTLEILVEEMQAHLLGQMDWLPQPVPFRNFVARARLGESGSDHEAFFREMLSDVAEPAAPFGLLDTRCDAAAVAEAQLDIDLDLACRLRAQARVLGVSPACLCHQAFALVLARVSCRSDVVFGTVLLGRLHGGEGVSRALGMFINTLPLRVRVDSEPIAESVRRTHRLLTELLSHEHASLALARKCTAIPVPAPLFSALLNYRHSLVGKGTAAEAARAWEGVETLYTEERSNYPFDLSVDDLGQGFRLAAQMQRPIDPHRICLFMHEALEQLVKALETAPDTPANAIDVLPEFEREQLLGEWAATAAGHEAGCCVQELFEAQVLGTPEAVAVVFDGERLTYAELNGRANQLAHHLRGLGAGPERVVGICAERSAELVTGILAILKSGSAYLPLDPADPAERLAFMIEDAGAPFVLTQEKLLGSVPQSGSTICLDRDAALWASAPKADLEPLGGPGNLAYVIYTSGSTGRPKGVEVAHRALTNRVLWGISEFDLNPKDVVLQRTLPSFDVSAWEILGSLSAGACLVIAGPAAADPDHLIELVQLHSVTFIEVVPSLLHALLRTSGWSECHTLRLVCCGGEAMSHELRAEFATTLCGCPLYNMYGPTEATIDASYFACDALEGSRGNSDAFVPLGRPIRGARLYVLDRHLSPVPMEVTGELFIGGAGLARGYHHQPGLTAERFVPDPFSEAGGRLYRTGDLARWRNARISRPDRSSSKAAQLAHRT